MDGDTRNTAGSRETERDSELAVYKIPSRYRNVKIRRESKKGGVLSTLPTPNPLSPA